MHHARDIPPPDAAADLAELTAAAAGIGRETVDVSGFLQDLDQRCQSQLAKLEQMDSHAGALSGSSERMLEAAQRMAETADSALDQVGHSSSFIAETGQLSQSLAEWVQSVHEESTQVEGMLQEVQTSNTMISDIALQVHILAINAKIEAARAGAAGKGFAIVADSVKDLSRKTSEAAERVTATVSRLSDWMARLHHEAQSTAENAGLVLTRSAQTDSALSDIQHGIGSLRDESHALSREAGQSKQAVDATGAAVRSVAGSVSDVSRGVDEASRRCFSMIDTSESILQHAVALGGNGEDSAMITLVQDVAGRISSAFEDALARREITQDHLFSRHYTPIPGSDPEQVMAPYTQLTDRLLPEIQEPVLDHDDRIVFCAAVDENGYLPTHNRKFSQPQGEDPVWNAAHSRNRRIFDDRVGLKAGQNRKPFLLQVYRRDMGGGQFVLMKDLSAPITVRGRHWGGVRLAYAL